MHTRAGWRNLLLRAAATALVAVAAAATAAQNVDAGAARTYQSATGLLNRGLHEPAAAEYRKFLAAAPNDARAPLARYGLAVCLYRLNLWNDAAAELAPLSRDTAFEFAAEVGLMLGECRLHAGQSAAAVEPLQRVAALPQHALAADASALLVEALHAAGRAEAALAEAKRFEERFADSPRRARVALLAGAAHVSRGEWQAGAARLSDVLRGGQPELREEAEFLLAQCHERTNRLDDAVRLFESAALRPAGRYAQEARLALCDLALRRGDSAGATRWLEQVDAKTQTCRAALLRARLALLAEKPADAVKLLSTDPRECADLLDQWTYWRAKARVGCEDAAGAVRELAAALRARPAGPLAAELRFEHGAALLKTQDYAGACAAFEELLSRHADHALAVDALRLLAHAELRRGEAQRSAAVAQRWLKAYPDHAAAPEVEFIAAECLMRTGKAEPAIAAYRRLLEQHPSAPQAPQAALRLGAALHGMQRWEDSIAVLTAALRAENLDRSLVEGLLLLGDAHMQRSAWADAEPWLDRYVRSPGAAAIDEGLLKLGVARARRGAAAESRATLMSLLENHPQSRHAHAARLELAGVLLRSGNPAEARPLLEQVAAQEKDPALRTIALEQLGTLALESKDFGGAAEQFGKAVAADKPGASAGALWKQSQALLAGGRHADAEAALRAFLQQHAGDPRAAAARVALVTALARQNQSAAALREAESAAKLELDADTRAALLYEVAWCRRREKRDDAAIEAYQALLACGSNGPQRTAATIELAELLAGAEKHEPALALLDPLRSSPEFARLAADLQARTLYRVGVCGLELNRTQSACDALEAFLAAHADHGLAPSARYFCGEANLKLGKLPAAAASFDALLAAKPAADIAAATLLRAGEVAAAQQNWKRSEELLSRFLREFPEHAQQAQAQFGVGWAQENTGRHAEAITSYRAVIARSDGPTAARAQFQLGECLYAQKKFAEAVTELLKVDILYASPEWSAAALYEAGRCLEELGKGADAQKQYQLVREKHPQSRWAELAAQRLSALAAATPPRPGG